MGLKTPFEVKKKEMGLFPLLRFLRESQSSKKAFPAL